MDDEPDQPDPPGYRHWCLDPGCPRSEDPGAPCSTREGREARRWWHRPYVALRGAERFLAKRGREPSTELRRAVEAARIASRLARLQRPHPGVRRDDLRQSRDMLRDALRTAAEGTFSRPLHPNRRRVLAPRLYEVADAARGKDGKRVVRDLVEGHLQLQLEPLAEEDPDGPPPVERIVEVARKLPNRIGDDVSRFIIAEDHRTVARRDERSAALEGAVRYDRDDDPDWTPPEPTAEVVERRLAAEAAAGAAELSRVEIEAMRDSAGLSELESAALDLWCDDAPYKEVADHLDTTVAAVKQAKYRAVKKLREVRDPEE